MIDPINSIQWIDAASLNANSYNPNIVFNAELRLLERSILKTGWVQPVLINTSKIIIDGFHRWKLSQDSPAIRKRYSGKVPCAVLPVTDDQAMLLTIRMNRAKGTHVAVRMAAIIKDLIDTHHLDPDQIAQEIGATRDEIDLLYQDSIFKARKLDEYRYSKAWKPKETSRG